ncbi:M48 family metallopeptidase [Sphingomonas sp.]|uniref:M48 family metallopeptidase n=1 Tax=Sphingomonas sp. TaxID=28214 RepID=UPI002D7F1DE0|nr:M48 family metallopeptidase [Sphingomonas sp.]
MLGGLAALLASVGAAPPEDEYTATFEALRAADVRLQRIGEGLATANVALCHRRQPALGIALHGPDQYLGDAKAAAIAHFSFSTDLGIAGTVPNGAAERAGLAADDSIISIAGRRIETLERSREDTAETARLAAFDRFVASLPDAAPLTIEFRRANTSLSREVTPHPACRARFEQRAADDVDVSADGVLVQISSRLLGELDDNGVAVLLAHELAHNVLDHRRRLDEAGVSRGLFAGFGRNVGLFRQTEVEADILAVHLLARAGYDPGLGARFWQGFGPRYASGLRLRTHPAWRDRVATMTAEAPRAAAALAAGEMPALIATRDQPLDGDWQSLLIEAD